MSEQINNKIADIIQAVLGDYASSCKVAPFDGQIMIEEDMGTAYSKLRNDLVESGKTSLLNINDYHGLTVQPKDTDGSFTILLNKKFILQSMENNNVDWLGTLVHEAVHVNDFKDYFNLVAASSYDELYEFSLHRIFLYWTEFHARAIGHYFLRKYTLVNFESQDHLEHLINEELPFQINYMVKHVGATTNVDSQMYTIVHFLGRLAVWQHLYPDVFTADFISELTNSNPWMEELYKITSPRTTTPAPTKSSPALDKCTSQTSVSRTTSTNTLPAPPPSSAKQSPPTARNNTKMQPPLSVQARVAASAFPYALICLLIWKWLLKLTKDNKKTTAIARFLLKTVEMCDQMWYI